MNNDFTTEVCLNGKWFEVAPISFVEYIDELRKRGKTLSPERIIELDKKLADRMKMLHRAKKTDLAIVSASREGLLGEGSPDLNLAIWAEWKKFGKY